MSTTSLSPQGPGDKLKKVYSFFLWFSASGAMNSELGQVDARRLGASA
ncbi:MAG: hypothetical protein MKZ85_06855 [Pedosphaera sp.]|nr:hypothetical protein [Pedosphaera sp.]